MVDSVVTKQELIDAQKDAQSLEDVINGPADTRVKPRIGPEMWTLATINSLVQQGQIKISDLSEAIQIALAAGAGSAGWTANLVADGNQTQKEINLYGGKKYDMPVGGYPLGAVVLLDNGDQVKSTISSNSSNPNNNMTGWVKVASIIVFNVVSEMLSKNLKAGDIVRTLGYNNLSDNGGAFYVISDTETSYSIPLNNGKHAVFNDSFDIRKFGIRNDATLDQATEIKRMIAYADDREYEIDFHGFGLMNPKMIGKMYGYQTDVKAMIFNKPHKLKNLFIANNKTEQLQQNTTCIAFMPSEPYAIEVDFVLDNVKLDPYVSDYNITSGIYDGGMHGFLAHPLHGGVLEYWGTTPSGYNFKFKDIHFVSPALSYNLSPSAIFSSHNQAKNLSGDYLGAYLNHHTLQLDADKVKGVYRDDLIAGRVLVTTLLHNEAELSGKPSVSYSGLTVKNSSSVKKSNGTRHLVSKYQIIGSHTIKEALFDNVVGEVDFYSANNKESLVINRVRISNSKESSFCARATINTLELDNFKVNSGSRYLLDQIAIGSLIGRNIDASNRALSVFGTANWTCNSININGVTIGDSTYGLLSNMTIKIPTINLKDVTVPSTNTVARIIDTNIGILDIDGLLMNDSVADYTNCVRNRGTDKASVSVRGLRNTRAAPSFDFFFLGFMDVSLSYSESIPSIKSSLSGGLFTGTYNGPQITGTLVYDPPSINSGITINTNVTVIGVVLGDSVVASINRGLSGLNMWWGVSATNTVTVYFKNETGAAIDLAALTITVKKI